MAGPTENRMRKKESRVARMLFGCKIPLASVALVLMAVSALSLVSCTSVVKTASASPRALAEDTKEIVQEITTGEQNIFSTLVSNFEKVQHLQASVSSGDDSEVLVNDVLLQLEEVASSFEGVSKKKETIREEFVEKAEELPKLMDKAEAEIESLKARKAEYEQKLVAIDSTSSESQQARRVSISQAIKYVERQIAIWEQFTTTQAAILDQANSVSTRVDAFMDIIEGNAIVYREAVNLLKLQRDIREALSVVTEGIPEIERLSKEMQDSWQTLNSLVDDLLTYSSASTQEESATTEQ